MRPDRHHFVTLDPASEPGWRHVPSCHGDGRERVGAWVRAGRPLVVASSSSDDPTGTIRLGVATPEKLRFGLLVEVSAVTGISVPPTLSHAASSAPSAWENLIKAICVVTRGHADCRVFGSLAWELMSNERFVRDTSDIDLLIKPYPGVNTSAVVDALLKLPGSDRLDGEIVLADGGGVNIREFHARPTQILVKRHGGPRLADFCEVLEAVDLRP